MTVSEFLSNKKIYEIYAGREEGCRCGCHGNYFKEGSNGFKRALNKAMKLNYHSECDNGHNAEPGHAIYNIGEEASWIDLWLPNNRTITIYAINK